MDRTESTASLPLLAAGDGSVIDLRGADVGRNREELRLRRLRRFAIWTGIPAALLWARIADGHPLNLLSMPSVDPMWVYVIGILVVMSVAMLAPFILFSRSPHVVYRPEQISTKFRDVIGIDPVRDEVMRSLNLFLAHKTFASAMGGSPRRGLLFEGPPGTGKTYTAKAMAAEAGVPFLFVSATAFQSMMYGATAMKIRRFFKAIRKTALAEGGAIAFIEEIDAIGGRRAGIEMRGKDAIAEANGGLVTSNLVTPGGAGAVVNELLVQMQSFDQPTGWQRLVGQVIDSINRFLPLSRQLRKRTPPHPNVLVIAATNRADSLDPALLRPGRFDRSLTFERPDQRGRRELIDYYLARKSHHDEIDDEHRDALAAVTHAYTPVMIEQLLDEGLIEAVRRGDNRMNWKDIERARLATTVGLGQPIGYTDYEKRLIATHEAGHATTAYLVAKSRRLEVLSIIKRREALGMLAHGDMEEVFTRSRAEMLQLIQIAFGGQVAEEIFFGDISTGPSGDLAYATSVAAQMVGAAGMAGSLISYAAVQTNALNDTNLVGRVLGDADCRRQVEELLQQQKMHVRGLIEANQHLVEALRDALLERDELVGREITAVLEAAGGPRQLTPATSPAAEKRVIDLTDHETRTTTG